MKNPLPEETREYVAARAIEALAVLDEDGLIDVARFIDDNLNPAFPHDPYTRAVLALRELRDTARGEGDYDLGGDGSLHLLEVELEEKEALLAAQGGRGVDLANEIDRLREKIERLGDTPA